MEIKPLIRAVIYYGEEVVRAYDAISGDEVTFHDGVQTFLDATQDVDRAEHVREVVEDGIGLTPNPYASMGEFDEAFLAGVFDDAKTAVDNLNNALQPLFNDIKTRFHGRENLSFKDLAKLSPDPLDQVLLGHVVMHECFREAHDVLKDACENRLAYDEASVKLKELKPYLSLNYKKKEKKELIVLFDTAILILDTNYPNANAMLKELSFLLKQNIIPKLEDRLYDYCHILTLAEEKEN